MSKKHPVFHDIVSLKAIFINQLLKSEAKHAMYVGRAKVFPLHRFTPLWWQMLTALTLKSVKIHPWHSASKNQQSPSFSMSRGASYLLSHVSFSGVKTKRRCQTLKKCEMVRKRECHWALFAEKCFAFYMLCLVKDTRSCLHNVHVVNFSLFIGFWIMCEQSDQTYIY